MGCDLLGPLRLSPNPIIYQLSHLFARSRPFFLFFLTYTHCYGLPPWISECNLTASVPHSMPLQRLQARNNLCQGSVTPTTRARGLLRLLALSFCPSQDGPRHYLRRGISANSSCGVMLLDHARSQAWPRHTISGTGKVRVQAH